MFQEWPKRPQIGADVLEKMAVSNQMLTRILFICGFEINRVFIAKAVLDLVKRGMGLHGLQWRYLPTDGHRPVTIVHFTNIHTILNNN